MGLTFDPADVTLPELGHRIGGRPRTGAPATTLRRPSDGQAYAEIPCADAQIVDEAVATARATWRTSGWGGCHPRERVRTLHAWADLIDAEAGELARLEALGSSRPIAELVKGDVATIAEQIRFFAEFADKEGGALPPVGDARFGMVQPEPYGVVGAITPWNFPLSMAVWKLAPALAAGNAVVIKPSEVTPLSTLRLVELGERAGLPAGLVNVVLGDGPVTGNALVQHPGVAKLSFTGSTRAGGAIMEAIGRSGVKPVTLELGGKSPQIVFADADLDLAAACVARGIVANAGQVCVAGSRLLVAREVAEELSEKISEIMGSKRPGATWSEESSYSPIISETQIARIESIVSASVSAGAEIVSGGTRLGQEGWFYAPTILGGITPDNPAVREEIFGPVLTLQTFTDEADALHHANHETYGLCAGVFTRDLNRAMRMTRRIEAGTVWVNRYGRSQDHIMPTGGYGGSGIGKDLGREAYIANCRHKTVLMDIGTD
ncbi:aldehyde dehydrogenase family protein [Rhodovibrio salinarum]|uniref:Aldehyde dehydrogenase n=1 Tax=Rhodovibrio salinarum TaxID=1087 RepID=A0A934V254_9PROT|nr:aldehyde dehydrogenase family protein [Rhodovibrio salinarum]MBK1699148.1 aldehyde dehydrogenase [Rhodovibrio salinarum]